MALTKLPDQPAIAEPDVFEAVGRLCAAWAFFEMVTEETLWGILGVDASVGPLITSRLDMRSRWSMIVSRAESAHDEDVTSLRKINKAVNDVTDDRNIIVHGLIHRFTSEDCAHISIFKGANAGKRYPLTQSSVEIVRWNILKLTQPAVDFGNKHKYLSPVLKDRLKDVENGWPTPLELSL